MEAYVERIKSNAENLIKDVFPKKALELDSIINVILLIYPSTLLFLFDKNLF